MAFGGFGWRIPDLDLYAVLTPAKIFDQHLSKALLKSIFEEEIAPGAARGLDGISVQRFEKKLDQELDIVLRKVRNCTYQFTRYREKLIVKSATKLPRQISIPTIRDKLVLKFLNRVLSEIYPREINAPPHNMVKRVHTICKGLGKDDAFLRIDIKNFYPTVDHSILMRVLRRTTRKKQLLTLIERSIETATGTGSTKSEIGIPQGLSISNILSSIYLSEIDDYFDGLKDIDYFRFVDDILIIGKNERLLELSKELPKLIKKKRKIECHPIEAGSKSYLSPADSGVEYLGYEFKLSAVRVRKSSQQKLFTSLMRVITDLKYNGKKSSALWRLNLRASGCLYKGKKIGWMFYFAQTNDLKQLHWIDRFIKLRTRTLLRADEQANLKRFVKSYHEIRFNFENSRYFPNFDNFTDEEKIEAMLSVNNRLSKTRLEALDSSDLDFKFQKLISREVSVLEADLFDMFS